MRSSVYQAPGIVRAWPRGLAGSKLEMISWSDRGIGIRVTENGITPVCFTRVHPAKSMCDNTVSVVVLNGGLIGPDCDGRRRRGQNHDRDFTRAETRVEVCRCGRFSSVGK